jgi:hypothetical protein
MPKTAAPTVLAALEPSTGNLHRISTLPSCIDTPCWDSIESVKRKKEFPMKKTARAALLASAAAAMAATGLAFTPAGPAAAASTAELTIAQLEAQGFDVKINRIGSAPLDECEVASVGKAREQKQLRRFGDDFIEVVVRRSISVSLDCSRR